MDDSEAAVRTVAVGPADAGPEIPARMATGLLARSRIGAVMLLADIVATVAMGRSDMSIFSVLVAIVLLYDLAAGAIAVFQFRKLREAWRTDRISAWAFGWAVARSFPVSFERCLSRASALRRPGPAGPIATGAPA
jgi:hypothetical protein